MVRRLSSKSRACILKAVEDQNRISDLLSGRYNCPTINDLPKEAHATIKALFDHAYAKLKALGMRDSQYRHIYTSVPDHVCPFCGAEYMDAPGAPREDLDHYLAKSLYPFAAANLRNLVPMGHKCNTSYKRAADVLRRPDGTRRVSFDPYNHTEITVILNDSDPFNGETVNTPNWVIRFDPDAPGITTWDEIFDIRERYCRDHLNPCFHRWIRHFGKWIGSKDLNIAEDEAIISALKEYENFWRAGGMQDRAFLKSAVFRMLHSHCASGNRRLLKVIRDLAGLAPASVYSADTKACE
jgi:hypothetical protein